MKLLLIACEKCGAPNPSPFGLCPECEARRVADRASVKRRIQVRAAEKRAA